MTSSVYLATVKTTSDNAPDIFQISAKSPQDAEAAVRQKLGPGLIVEVEEQPLTDDEAKASGLTIGALDIG